MISVDHLTKEFRLGTEVVRALDDVSLRVERGEFVTVAGPSGSGKSTLLMSIGGLIHPTSGGVRIGDVNLYAQSVNVLAELRRRTIGFVFQQFHLIPYLTAWENVALPLMLNGHQSRCHNERAIGLLERFELGSRANHKPSQLSVGQQQRVAMARMLANDPDVILADEPTASLDPTLARHLVQTLTELNHAGKTVVLVTHSPELAAVGTRRLALHDGVIEEE
ncbi:MAG TPA: ABC transporter ATP-binding protein [Acidobacteriota bacterium]|nr:ABC transporter ATP-binding protein [Acidobacteriota bacterium]